MRRELTEEIELIRPRPKYAQRELRPQGRALRKIAIVTAESDREAGHDEWCLLFEIDIAALRRPSPPQRDEQDDEANRRFPNRHEAPPLGVRVLLQCADASVSRACVEARERRGGGVCEREGDRSDPARRRPRLLARGRLPSQWISWEASRLRSRDNTLEERCPVFPCGVPLHRDDDYTRECPGRPLRGQTPTPARPGGSASA